MKLILFSAFTFSLHIFNSNKVFADTNLEILPSLSDPGELLESKIPYGNKALEVVGFESLKMANTSLVAESEEKGRNRTKRDACCDNIKGRAAGDEHERSKLNSNSTDMELQQDDDGEKSEDLERHDLAASPRLYPFFFPFFNPFYFPLVKYDGFQIGAFLIVLKKAIIVLFPVLAVAIALFLLTSEVVVATLLGILLLVLAASLPVAIFVYHFIIKPKIQHYLWHKEATALGGDQWGWGY